MLKRFSEISADIKYNSIEDVVVKIEDMDSDQIIDQRESLCLDLNHDTNSVLSENFISNFKTWKSTNTVNKNLRNEIKDYLIKIGKDSRWIDEHLSNFTNKEMNILYSKLNENDIVDINILKQSLESKGLLNKILEVYEK